MRDIENFEYVEDFIEEIFEYMIQGAGIAVYAPTEIIEALILELIRQDDEITLGSVDYSDEKDLFLLELSPEDNEVYVTPAIGANGNFVACEQDVYFVHGDINSKVYKVIPTDVITIPFVTNDEDYNYKDDYVFTELSKDDKGCIHGYTQSGTTKDGITWSKSYYSTDEEDVRKHLREKDWDDLWYWLMK